MPYTPATTSGTTRRPRRDLEAAYFEFDPVAEGMGRLIGAELAPVMPIPAWEVDQGVLPTDVWLSREDTRRAEGVESSQSDWGHDTKSIRLDEYAHKVFIDSQRVLRDGAWFDHEEISAGLCRMKILLDHEVRVKNLLFDTTEFSGDKLTGADNAWDTANGTPIEDIVEAKRAGIGRGEYFNYGVMSRYLADQIIARFPSNLLSDNENRALTVSEQILAQATQIPRWFITDAIQNTAVGGETRSLEQIWPENYVFLGVMNTGRRPIGPYSVRTARLAGVPGVTLDTWLEDDPDGEWVRARDYMKLVTGYNRPGQLIGGVKT